MVGKLIKLNLLFDLVQKWFLRHTSSMASKTKDRFIITGMPVMAILFTGCSGNGAMNENTPPNIIIILLDDAGYNDFGFMDSKDLKTPNIDWLAQQGTVLSDAHVSASVCSPSRAGLLTGRYQQRFGHECNPGNSLYGTDTSEVMLSNVLNENGYTTAAIGKWHLGHESQFHPNRRGFDYFFGFLDGGRSYFYDEEIDNPGNPKAVLENAEQVDFEGYLTDVFGTKTIAFIDENKESPFFIYLAYNAVHTPMEATEQDLNLFEGHPRQTLAAMTWAVDRSIGEIVSKLKQEGIYDNTLIFFLSDNGGAHNNNSINMPLKGYKGNQYEGGHRIPFFMTWGDKFSHQPKFDGLSSSLDIFATCLDAAQIKNNSGNPLDGVSLIPYLLGDSVGNPHDNLFWRKANMKAARVQNKKLIYVDHLGYKFYSLQDNLNEDADIKETDMDSFLHSIELLNRWDKELAEPLWLEGPVWDSISTLINRDLYNNADVALKNDIELVKTKREISSYFQSAL